MKNLILPWALTLLFLLLISCTDNIVTPPIGEGIDVTEIIAYTEGDSPSTKTGLVDDASGKKNVVWKAGNSISLFFNQGENGGDKFTTASNGSVAKFTGTISAVSGDLSDTGGKAYFWGLYPYNANASCDGTAITTSLPASQMAYQGDVANNLLVTVGRSENLAIYFKNTCAVIAFTLSQDNISKITFQGRNNEKVAGEFKASFGSGNQLTITPTDKAVNYINVTPAESATFVKGKTYYFAILPQNFASGYTLTFTKNDETVASYERTTSFNFAISTFYTMTNKDSGLTFASVPVPEAVDLGLSVKWASFNIGASAPEEYGDYYAWGETEPHYVTGHSQDSPCSDWRVIDGKTMTGYNWPSYKWCNGSETTLTKYNNNSSYGTVDYKTELEEADDVAHVLLGGAWRIPTKTEWTELLEKCTCIWTTQNGVTGVLVTGTNGNSIFLPATGYRVQDILVTAAETGGYYWSSSLFTTSSQYDGPSFAWDCRIRSKGVAFMSNYRRNEGHSVRPVYAE